MKYLFLLYLLYVSFFDLNAADLKDIHKVNSSDKMIINATMGQKMEIESITWIGGWGLIIKHFNETKQKMEIDFDRITLSAKSKDFSSTYQIPFSFKGIIPSQDSNLYIVPLNDLDLPSGLYSLTLVFEKNSEIRKGSEKKDQFVSVQQAEISKLVAPPKDYKKVSQIKASDVFLGYMTPELVVPSKGYKKDTQIKECEYIIPVNVYYHCFSKNGDLFIRMRTETSQDNKPFVGEIYSPLSGGDREKVEHFYGRRTHTALARLKIKITTGEESKTFYHPLPVYFSLPAGEKVEFTVCLKKMEWDDKKTRLEIEHVSAPEGYFFNCLPLPFSQMIFHKDKNK